MFSRQPGAPWMKVHKPGQRPGWQPGGSISPTPGGRQAGCPRGPCGPRWTGPSCAPSISLFSLPPSWPSSEVSQLHPRPQLLAHSEWWAKLPRSSYQTASPFGPLGPLHLLIESLKLKIACAFLCSPGMGPPVSSFPGAKARLSGFPSHGSPALPLTSPHHHHHHHHHPHPSLRSIELN